MSNEGSAQVKETGRARIFARQITKIHSFRVYALATRHRSFAVTEAEIVDRSDLVANESRVRRFGTLEGAIAYAERLGPADQVTPNA